MLFRSVVAGPETEADLRREGNVWPLGRPPAASMAEKRRSGAHSGVEEVAGRRRWAWMRQL